MGRRRNGKLVNCDNCGKQIYRSVGQLSSFKNIFCNKTCKGEWMSKNLSGKNHCRWQGGDVKLNCETCGKEIIKSRTDFNGAKNHFCSKKCWGEYLSKNKSGENWHSWSRIEVECNKCGKILLRQKKQVEAANHIFCSRKCRIGYFLGEKHPLNSKIKVKCLNCKKEIFRKRCEVEAYEKLFCSRQCRDKYSRGDKHHCWNGGTSLEPYGLEFNNYLKLKIRERDKFCCLICGCSEEENGRSLDIHHVDYDKKNNSDSNLVSLCRKNGCHSKTLTKRQYWTTLFQNLLSNKYKYNYNKFACRESITRKRFAGGLIF